MVHTPEHPVDPPWLFMNTKLSDVLVHRQTQGKAFIDEVGHLRGLKTDFRAASWFDIVDK